MPLFLLADFAPKLELEHRSLNRANLKGSDSGFAFGANRIAFSNALIGAGYDRWDLRWHNQDKLPSGLKGEKAPVSTMHAFGLSTKLYKRLDDDKLWLSGIGTSLVYEKETNDALSLSLYTLIMRPKKIGFSYSYGVATAYHPVRTRFLPVFGLGYKQDKLNASIGYQRTYIGYELTEKWQISSGVIYSTILTKLAKDSTVEKDGYLEINSWQSDLALAYKHSKQTSIETSLRYSPIYDFTTYNANGHKIETYKMQEAFGVAIKFVYRF